MDAVFKLVFRFPGTPKLLSPSDLQPHSWQSTGDLQGVHRRTASAPFLHRTLETNQIHNLFEHGAGGLQIVCAFGAILLRCSKA
jgi:hypothetical protein